MLTLASIDLLSYLASGLVGEPVPLGDVSASLAQSRFCSCSCPARAVQHSLTLVRAHTQATESHERRTEMSQRLSHSNAVADGGTCPLVSAAKRLSKARRAPERPDGVGAVRLVDRPVGSLHLIPLRPVRSTLSGG